MTFWHEGHVTLNDIGQGGKTCSIRKSIDPKTGKETKATEFNQVKWGLATNGYLNSIKSNITRGKFNWASFVKAAKEFKKQSCNNGESAAASLSITPGSMDAHALIVEDSDDSDASSNNSGHNNDD